MKAQDNRLYAQIQHGKVHWLFTKAELPEWNNDMCPAVDITDLTVKPQVGWLYDGVSFSEPQPIEPLIVIPDSITMRQCRLQLLADGVYEIVNTAVPSMGTAAVIEWEYAMYVDRTNPLVPGMRQLLGWTDARVDQFYTEAAVL